MKRCWLIVAFLMLMVLTSACGDEYTENEVLIEEAVDEQPVVAFAHRSVNSYTYLIMNEAMKKAVEVKGWTFLNSIADHDPMRQNQQVMNFIKKKPDAIIVNPIDSSTMVEVMERGQSETIPMCTIDNNVTGNVADIEVSFDNYQAGVMAAEKIVELLIEKYGVVQGTVLNGYGAQESNALKLRKKGFESVILQYSDIDYLPVSTESSTEIMKDEIIGYLESGKRLDAIHTPSEFFGEGMVEALKETENWHRSDHPDHITLVTIDGGPYFVNLVNEGFVDGIIVQDVIAYGFIMVELLNDYVFKDKAIIEGEYFSNTTFWKSYYVAVSNHKAVVTIPPYLLDESNAEEKTHWSYKATELWGFQFNR